MTRVLAWADYYEPGYRAGGPIASLRYLALDQPADVELRLVTRCRDLGSRLPYADVPTDQWTGRSKWIVWYFSPSSLAAWIRLIRAIRRYRPDVYYCNSYFSPAFSRVPLLMIRAGILPRAPVLLAPRGELLPGALALKNRKKRYVRALSAVLGLDSMVSLWQASTTAEGREIRSALGQHARCAVVTNSASLQPLRMSRSRSGNRTRVLFLGRVSPIKNIHVVIEVAAALEESMDLHIYGPIDNVAYWNRCKSLIQGSRNIFYHSEVLTSDVAQVIREHDFLVLVSDSENFGHVVLEALRLATPVIVSETTPWSSAVAGRAGYVVPPRDRAALRETLLAAAGLSPECYESLSKGCADALAAYGTEIASAIPASRLFRSLSVLGGESHN